MPRVVGIEILLVRVDLFCGQSRCIPIDYVRAFASTVANQVTNVSSKQTNKKRVFFFFFLKKKLPQQMSLL